MLQEDYTVRLDAFQGPLDLLLYLIRRAEVDITDIPIAEITDQYLEFLKGLSQIDIELAGEFLVVAATLMEIKSRMLMPPDPMLARAKASEHDTTEDGSGLDRSDPRYELVKQLLEYKLFREAADKLDERRRVWEMRSPTVAAGRPKLPQLESEDDDAAIETDLEDIGAWDLLALFQRIIEAVDFGRLGDHQVEYDDTPIRLHQEDLLDQVQRSSDRRLSLREAFIGRSRGEVIGLFLATLELVRERRVTVRQDRVNDDIVIELREEEPESVSPNDEPAGFAAATDSDHDQPSAD